MRLAEARQLRRAGHSLEETFAEISAMLHERKASYWLLAAAFDWSVIGASLGAAYSFDHWLAYLAAWLIVGNRQHALALLGHDGAHRLICRNRNVNDWLTCLVAFWPLGTDLEPYRRFHFAHHRHVGTAKDPEAGWKRITPGNDPPLTGMNIVRWFVMDLFGLGALESVWYFKHYRPKPWGPLAWWACVGLVAWSCGMLWAVALWQAAFLTSFWAFFRLRTYIEHWGTTGTHRFRPRVWQLCFLPHNAWAHYEHHWRPDVPFWALPRLAGSKSGHRAQAGAGAMPAEPAAAGVL